MRRRAFVAGFATAWPLRALGQQPPERTGRIGVLRAGESKGDPIVEPLRKFLRQAGWEEGRNLTIIYRWAEDRDENLAPLAEQLLAERVGVLVTTGNPPTRALQRATAAVPIVTLSDDIVEGGLAASMARPGGNTTGVSIFAPDLDAKRLEILHDYVPHARRIAVLMDPSTTSSARFVDKAADRLGLELVRVPVANMSEIGRALREIAAARSEAANVLASPLLNRARNEIIRGLNGNRIAAIYHWPETPMEGGLLGYGPRLTLCYAQIAALVDKILRGALPTELPIEQPTKFELVVNMQTARELGLTIPPTLLARADEVIE